ncbi:nipped-B-like protein B [Neltuma alba]|uniref:nipped-B-like protein B n=1 Tax=Neltuma alba TaxID=207710 RepID=UPI0010A416B0|nr:nipped-B-like protein B [Prosopis alba]
MPRSSKHKSSKHSSRDTRDYSDSDKDSCLKDRKGKDESTVKVSKDSSSFEKRKPDSKDVHGFGNGENSDEYASSKRRKERSNDGVGDRWNGGEDERGEGSKKSKTSGDSKSRRRDESVGVYGEGEEVKKSSSKGEGKHKEQGRKESRESGMEKERKFKEVRSERSVDNEEQRTSKHAYENTDLRALDELRSPELDSPLERRLRKKKDDTSDGIKHQDDVGDSYSKRLSSRDEIAKDGRLKDEKRKDEKYREKGREETDKENKHRYDRQRDERPAKDHASSRSDDKHGKEEKDYVESRQKRIKTSESDRDRDHNRDRDGGRERDLESGRDRERRHERERDRERDYDLDRDRDYDRDRDWDWDNERDHDEDLDKDRHRERNHHRDRDGSHLDERSVRTKESGTKKRNLGERDDYGDTKSRGVKTHYSDAEKRSLSGSKADSEADRGRSQSRHVHADSSGTSSKRRSSPAANTHTGNDDYRNANSDDSKHRDSMSEQRTKGLRDGYSGTSERGTNKYKSEKSFKIDDGTVGDFATERSSSSKASPKGLVERSPSSTSIERRYVNKSGARRSLEIEESGRRNSIDARDFSASEDRMGRELTLERPLMDESSQADSSYYGRTSQGNASLGPPPPAFRAGLDRPFMSSLDDDVRDSSNARYRRISDPGFGRGPGNSWRGVPNWTSAVPNGFVPFQHGPTHGGFQAIMPQFPSQPIFGVRPPMDVNHAGIPYHIPDADRFPGHLRPLGWQNMMDGTGPSHLHGWDGNNGVFRDDPHMYGGSDWDRNRHPTNSRSWESGSETWKEQNGDLKKDLPSPAHKDGLVPAEVDDGLAEQDIQISQDEQNQDTFQEKDPEIKSPSVSNPSKAPLKSLATSTIEKVPDTATSDIASLFSHFYLSKLDISEELTLPELHNQCMDLLRIDKSSSIDAESCTDLLLKNDSGVRQKYATTMSRHSPLPAIDPSIFQRAMDLYKKQRVKLPTRGKVDIIPAFNQVQDDESAPIHSSENGQVSVFTSDASVKQKSTSDLKIGETLHPSAEEHLEELDQACSQKRQDHVQDHVCINSLGLVLSAPSDHGNKGEPLAASGEKEEKETSEMMGSGESKENQSMEVENKSLLVPDLHKDDVDTLGDPLIFGDGSSKACDALMAGSNESESLILSRIHHSPESTH